MIVVVAFVDVYLELLGDTVQSLMLLVPEAACPEVVSCFVPDRKRQTARRRF